MLLVMSPVHNAPSHRDRVQIVQCHRVEALASRRSRPSPPSFLDRRPDRRRLRAPARLVRLGDRLTEQRAAAAGRGVVAGASAGWPRRGPARRGSAESWSSWPHRGLEVGGLGRRPRPLATSTVDDLSLLRRLTSTRAASEPANHLSQQQQQTSLQGAAT